MLEKVADSARKAVKLAEPHKPCGGQFLEFRSISLSTYQTCMKLIRKSTEFCQCFCRHYPQSRPWRILLEKVADSARKAVKLAEPYKPYGVQFLEFCSISLSTYQTCMKLTRKSTEFCQFFCRHYPPRPTAKAYP